MITLIRPVLFSFIQSPKVKRLIIDLLGNDSYLRLNTNAAEVTNTDYIDPLSTGFTVTASAPAALNVSGGTYIFLAIA